MAEGAPGSQKANIIPAEADEYKGVIRVVNREDFIRLINVPREELDTNEELRGWMEANQLSFDSGPQWVIVDGEQVKINTSKDDFGTVFES